MGLICEPPRAASLGRWSNLCGSRDHGPLKIENESANSRHTLRARCLHESFENSRKFADKTDGHENFEKAMLQRPLPLDRLVDLLIM